jgi:hypothetical protein
VISRLGDLGASFVIGGRFTSMDMTGYRGNEWAGRLSVVASGINVFR